MKKTFFLLLLCACQAFFAVALEGAKKPASKFVCPGVVLTRFELDFLKNNLDKEPWKSGFERLKNDPLSQLNFTMRGPCEKVIRYPWQRERVWEWGQDMAAAYNLARMWYFTDDEAYAKKARDILIAWAETQTVCEGWEIGFDLGEQAFRYVGAADILRGTWPGWTKEDTKKMEKLFREVYLPATGYFSHSLGPTAKGAMPMAGVFAMAIFLQDEELFLDAMKTFLANPVHSLRSSNSLGQLGESGRDQGHWYWQMFCLAFCAETAWKQGIDLYSACDARLIAIGEYYARNAAGRKTPFLPFGTLLTIYRNICGSGWTHGRAGFNMIASAARRIGIQTPCIDAWSPKTNDDSDAFCFILPSDGLKRKKAHFHFPKEQVVTQGLVGANIGNAEPTGSLRRENGTWIVSGAGEEIWRHGAKGESDSLFYAWKKVEGPFSAVVRVDSVQGPKPNGKAVLMMRKSLDPNEPTKAWIGIADNGNVECFMSGWSSMFGGENWEKGAFETGFDAPGYLKIERIGDLIHLFWSPEGTSWTNLCTGWCENLPKTLYVGLGACSIQNGERLEAKFSRFSMTGADGGEIQNVFPPDRILAVSADAAEKGIILRWSESHAAERYRIERAPSAKGSFETIGETKRTSFRDADAKKGEIWFYRIRGVNSRGVSPASPTASCKAK